MGIMVKSKTVGLLLPWQCPDHLFAPLIKIVIDEIRQGCKKQPINYGFNSNDNAYEPLKLMQAVMAKINEVCLRYLDNSMLCSLPAPSNAFYVTSICARRNRRRRMEDKHVAIHDLNTMFNIQEASPSSYFAIFDGHAGHDAASYSAAHLHQYLAENKQFACNPDQALKDAFCKTDALFLEKCKVESLTGGTTAVVALLRPKEKYLYIAWVGDSQALLVKQGQILQCVNPHKPCREDERARIEQAGGCVIHWGTWRVNGQLAVSRAIGDADYKPHVTAIPDVKEITMDGNEDFLIIACDGLWDFVSEDAAAQQVYYKIAENPDDTDRISKHLSQVACLEGSSDNISIIIVFLRDPHQIAAEAPRWANKNGPTLSASNMEAGLDNANNPFTNSNGSLKNLDVVDSDNINLQMSANDGLLLNLTDNFKANGTDLSKDIFGTEKSNGMKKSVSDGGFDDDFGPESNVDEVLSPIEKEKAFTEALVKGLQDESVPSFLNDEAKSFTEGLVNNNPLDDAFNPFLNNDDKENAEGSKEFDLDDFRREHREETPTPPVEEVHDEGLVNPTESDSEDEWNYIKGDQSKPENIPLQPDTVLEASESDDAMSQLNPNAAEFVPVSPTRSIPSPACRSLLNEEVISQSPKRPERVDIRVPSETEFDSEVKSRPSDFEKNGHDSEHDSSSDDKIEELLNGKSIDEIPEFQPGSTPAKPSSEEFHFGPNAAPFTPKVLDQSEAFSTKAEYGDDTAQLNVSFDSGLTAPLPKEDTDPMSMSFYAEKGGANPFQNSEDLNKVHQVPDNLDDFLGDISDNKENCGFDETISDLPEHDPLGFGNEAIQTTDLDKLSQDDDKEIAPAMNAAKESGDVLRSDLDCFEGHTSEPLLNPPCLVSLAGDEITSSPSPQALAATPEPDSSVSPAADKLDILNTQEVVPQEASVPADFEQHFIAESQPAPEQIDAQPEVCTASDLEAPPCELNVAKEEDEQPPKDQVEFLTSESADLLSGFSHPVPACEYSAEPELCELLAQDNTFQAPHSPVDLLQETKDEITSSVKDDVSSPIDQISHASLIEDPVEIPVSDTLLTDLSCPLPSAQPPSDAFEPSAPVEPSFNGVDNFSNEPNEQICIKTESIKPEFAEPAEIPLDTPSETLLTPTEIIEPPQVSDSLIPEAVPQVQPPQISDSLVSEAVPEVQPVLPVVAEAAAAASAASINAEPKPVANEKDKRKPIGKVEPRKSTSSTPRVGTSTKTLNQSASKTGVTAKTTPKAATSKPATLAAPKSSPRPSTKPKTAAPATSKPTEAATKPSATANLRPVPKPLTRKAPTEAPATKTLTRPATAAAPKTNSTKPTASSRPATSPRSLAAKPAASTAPAKPAAPSKPRVPLSSRTTTTAAATAASKPPASTVTKTTTATSKTASSPKRAPLASRPQTITGAVAKPRVPLTKTVTKSADVEKEKKESANKLTASRTTTTTRTASNTATARSTTTTVKRTETKPLSDRAVASKTSTTTRTTTLSKRPADLKAVSKAKTTKIEKPKENGIAPATVTQEITVVNNIVNQTESETLLVKDNSPIDNKLLIETSNSLVDTTPAD